MRRAVRRGQSGPPGRVTRIGFRVGACRGDALEAQRKGEEQRGANRAVHQVETHEESLGLGLAVVTRWKHSAEEKSSDARTLRSTRLSHKIGFRVRACRGDALEAQRGREEQ